MDGWDPGDAKESSLLSILAYAENARWRRRCGAQEGGRKCDVIVISSSYLGLGSEVRRGLRNGQRGSLMVVVVWAEGAGGSGEAYQVERRMRIVDEEGCSWWNN